MSRKATLRSCNVNVNNANKSSSVKHLCKGVRKVDLECSVPRRAGEGPFPGQDAELGEPHTTRRRGVNPHDSTPRSCLNHTECSPRPGPAREWTLRTESHRSVPAVPKSRGQSLSMGKQRKRVRERPSGRRERQKGARPARAHVCVLVCLCTWAYDGKARVTPTSTLCARPSALGVPALPFHAPLLPGTRLQAACGSP